MFYITFNGETSTSKGLAVAKRPSIPAPQPRGEYVDIAGRDGSLLITDGTYENIEIDVEMNFVGSSLGDKYRTAKRWLQGSGNLIMSDDNEVFYRVKAAAITSHDRRAKTGADIVASFVCDPFTYYASGATEQALSGTVNNPYMESCPIYKITGEGAATLTVNGNTMTANVGQNITIDTEKMMAYRLDGTLQNTAVSGDFAALRLAAGENTIAITSGFTLSVIPNWRTL